MPVFASGVPRGRCNPSGLCSDNRLIVASESCKCVDNRKHFPTEVGQTVLHSRRYFVPFVHAHRNNEEIYGVLSGRGSAVIDGETVALTEGDWLRVAPAAKRQFSADADSGITYICIQVKENSLGSFTADDAVVY